jgi:hypothetical protein
LAGGQDPSTAALFDPGFDCAGTLIVFSITSTNIKGVAGEYQRGSEGLIAVGLVHKVDDRPRSLECFL